MSRIFQNVLNMTWSHGYYINGNDVVKDFTVTPTASTAKLLKRRNLFFKDTEQGFSIYCDNVTIPQLPSILGSQTLHFYIKLKNSDFMHFTQPPNRSGGKDIYYLECVQSGATQAIQAIPLYPPVFTYTFTAPQNDPTLQLTDPEGIVRLNESFPTAMSGNELSVSVNLTAYTSGRYTVSIAGQQSNTYLYISHEQPEGGIFGIAAITLPPSGINPNELNASTPLPMAYNFQFSAKAAYWRYNITYSTLTTYNGGPIGVRDIFDNTIIYSPSLSNPSPNVYDSGMGYMTHEYSPGTYVYTSDTPISYNYGTEQVGELYYEYYGMPTFIRRLPSPDIYSPFSFWDNTLNAFFYDINVTL